MERSLIRSGWAVGDVNYIVSASDDNEQDELKENLEMKGNEIRELRDNLRAARLEEMKGIKRLIETYQQDQTAKLTSRTPNAMTDSNLTMPHHSLNENSLHRTDAADIMTSDQADIYTPVRLGPINPEQRLVGRNTREIIVEFDLCQQLHHTG